MRRRHLERAFIPGKRSSLSLMSLLRPTKYPLLREALSRLPGKIVLVDRGLPDKYRDTI